MEFTHKIKIDIENITFLRGAAIHFKDRSRKIVGNWMFFNHSKEKWIDKNFFAEHNMLEKIEKNI